MTRRSHVLRGGERNEVVAGEHHLAPHLVAHAGANSVVGIERGGEHGEGLGARPLHPVADVKGARPERPRQLGDVEEALPKGLDGLRLEHFPGRQVAGQAAEVELAYHCHRQPQRRRYGSLHAKDRCALLRVVQLADAELGGADGRATGGNRSVEQGLAEIPPRPRHRGVGHAPSLDTWRFVPGKIRRTSLTAPTASRR